jgi:VWFA-related protein
VIWFSGSFPISILPTKGQDYDFEFSEELRSKLRETTNMLAAAQVAIDPVAAEGLDPDSYASGSRLYPLGASTVQPPQPGQTVTPSMGAGQAENAELQQEHTQRYANQATIDEVAKDTGGEAFYNTNGLKDALAHVISNGAHYYTISYSPSDKRIDGRYRSKF